ncbi:MAG: hypothetical protein ACPLRH_01120, partial [Desulfotomaculales bacterium]
KNHKDKRARKEPAKNNSPGAKSHTYFVQDANCLFKITIINLYHLVGFNYTILLFFSCQEAISCQLQNRLKKARFRFLLPPGPLTTR